jgi:hypothetical protein
MDMSKRMLMGAWGRMRLVPAMRTGIREEYEIANASTQLSNGIGNLLVMDVLDF